MKLEVRDIYVQKLRLRIDWDDENKAISTTIEIKTVMPSDALEHLIHMGEQGRNLYMTIVSDQATFDLPLKPDQATLDLEAAPVGAGSGSDPRD